MILAKKRPIIEVKQKYNVVCDNPDCDYVVVNESGDPNQGVDAYLNVPCPECGEILLTDRDYSDYKNLMKVVNWINKWFIWLTLFIPRKRVRSNKVHVHKGIHITKDAGDD